MSQYNSMPLPGPYIRPAQGGQPNSTTYGGPNQSQKGVGGFGQMMNQRLEQAVTTGKPMLNKLGKTISSKLGNKPAGGPPQHLQSYQNYQTHYGQQDQSHYGQQNQTQSYQQPPGQAFSPQSQPQQWGQQQHQPPHQAPNAYPSPQQSSYQQSTYSTPTSSHSGHNNYFPQQTTQPPSSQSYAPQSPLSASGQTSWQYGQGGGITEQTQAYGQASPGQPHTPVPQQTQEQGQYAGQQMSVVGGSYVPQHTPPPHTSSMSPVIPAQPVQSQWQPGAGQQSGTLSYPSQPNASTTSPPLHAVQQYQWNNPSPVNSHGQGQSPTLPPSTSPPPSQPTNASPQVQPNKAVQSSQPSTPASHYAAAPPSAPTEFIAELPAELPTGLGNLSLVESKTQESVSGSQYQAFRPSASQTASPSPGFTIPRRSLSASTVPLADPWRFADAATEVPTREFYILADLLFDALDRKFEPRNTGLLEAPKIMGSWVKLTEDASRLFSYRNYSAFAKLWSLEGIPHMMVPCQSELTPNWNFNQHSHAQDVKVKSKVPTPTTTYTTYMPALNRAGWYKFFFLEVMHTPEDIGDLIPALCADTYKPEVLNHPDLDKRDRTDVPALQARAAEIQTYAIGRVCEETKVAMAVDPDVPLAHTHPTAPVSGTAQTSPEDMADMAVRMHKIQAEQQQNNMAAWTMLGLQPKGYPGGGYGSLV